MVPYVDNRVVNETIDGRVTNRTQRVRAELFLSPVSHQLRTVLEPERKKKALYETVIIMREDLGPPVVEGEPVRDAPLSEAAADASSSKTATISLVEPADIYAQVDRSVKYGFLFIGFTFIVFLLFDVVGGARVAAAEYLLTGAGLVLFFVLLLAFAEWIGFALAYVIASAAIIDLLTAHSAAVLGGWRRAAFIGGMLTALYFTLRCTSCSASRQHR